MKKYITAFSILLLLFLISCSFYGKKRGPSDWYRIPKPSYEIPPYAKYLRGMRFCLDPGHGGQAYLPGYKRGPTGVREAEMNLRLALFLKEFLEKAGAEVILTRDDDYFISLEDRARIANENGVDLFISIHHNASSNPEANYTTVWYHGDADYRPVNLDAARYVCNALIEYTRLPDIVPSPLMSDFNMYPSGFGVLRRLKVPGILVEGSFFSNPKEEKLLAKAEYNKLFAYAYFVGLAKWAYAGFPESELLSPEPNSKIQTKTPLIVMKYTDGIHERDAWILERQQVFTESINFYIDDSLFYPVIDRQESLLHYKPSSPLPNGLHKVHLNLRNMYGNHNLPQPWYFTVALPADTVQAIPWALSFPPDPRSFVKISVLCKDIDGETIADGDSILIRSDYGVMENSFALAKNGKGYFILHAGSSPDTARIIISSGNAKDTLVINFNDTSSTVLEGQVTDADKIPVPDASCAIDTFNIRTDEEGYFFLHNIPTGYYSTAFSHLGYFTKKENRNILKGRTNIINPILEKIADGVFHDQLIVIDPRYGGSEIGEMINDTLSSSQVNLQIAIYLARLLQEAGAKPYLLRDAEIYMDVEARIDSCNSIDEENGVYFRLDVAGWNELKSTAEGMFYPGNRLGENLVKIMSRNLALLAGDTITECYQAWDQPEIRETKYPALAVQANFIGNPIVRTHLADRGFIKKIALTIFYSFAEYYLEKEQEFLSVKFSVIDGNKQPLSDFPLTLGGVLTLYTDNAGEVEFPFLKKHRYSLSYYADGKYQEMEFYPGKEYSIEIIK